MLNVRFERVGLFVRVGLYADRVSFVQHLDTPPTGVNTLLHLHPST